MATTRSGASPPTGTVTNYTGTGINGPTAITAGPDGALWFTNYTGSSIGRITTTGTVTNYTGTGISDPDRDHGRTRRRPVVHQPRQQLDRADHHRRDRHQLHRSHASADRTGSRPGPTARLWFTNFGNNSIGRINTAAPPTVIPGGASVLEGTSGTAELHVGVSLSNPSTQTVTVQWNTAFVGAGSPIEADPASDYTTASGTVTFAPGETQQTVAITVNGDTLVEPNELIIVRFHAPTNAVLGGFYGLGFGVITNDDHAVIVPGGDSVVEGDTGTAELHVGVSLSNPSTQPITVQWNTASIGAGSPIEADPATDYTAASGAVTFAPGETEQTVAITVNGDTLVEPDEWMIVRFHDPTNAVLGGFYGLGFGVITNDD